MKNLIKFSTLGAFVILLVFGWQTVFAQDTRYTMPYSNLMNLNPSLAGASKDLRVNLNYRNQWAALDKGFVTYSVAGFYPLILGEKNEAMGGGGDDNGTANTVNSKLDFGLGVQYYKAGAFGTLDVGISAGYTVRLAANHYLASSIFGSFVMKSLNTTGLTFDDQYVLGSFSESNASNELIVDEKLYYGSVGAGVTWFYNEGDDAKLNSYIGLSAFNLNMPNESFIGGTGKLPIRYSAQAGLRIRASEKIHVTPNVIYTFQRSSQLLNVGAYLDFTFNEQSKMLFGTWYKVGDAAAFMVGFEHQYFTIGYAYDLVTSSITNSISGLHSHNVTASFKLDMAKKKGLFINNPVVYF